MAAIAPDTTSRGAGLARLVRRDAGNPGTGARSRTMSPRPAGCSDGPRSTLDDVARAAAGCKRRSPRGRRPATRSGRASCAAPPTSTRRTAPSSAHGRARDRRHRKQDAPRAELHLGELLAAATMPWQPYGSLVPTPFRGGCRWSAGCRSAWSARSRRGTRRACSGCASSRRRSPSATPSSSSRIRRHRSAAAPCSRRSSGKPGCPTACSRSSSATPRSARRWSPTRTSTWCPSPDRPRRAGASASSRGDASRRCGSSSAATTRSSCSTTRTSTPRPRPARSQLPVPGPGLLRRRAPHRPREPRVGLRRCVA